MLTGREFRKFNGKLSIAIGQYRRYDITVNVQLERNVNRIDIFELDIALDGNGFVALKSAARGGA